MNAQGKNLLGWSLERLSNLAEEHGEPRYRGQQLFQAIYRDKSGSLDGITTLPAPFRHRLQREGFTISVPALARKFESADGTIRYLLRFEDGQSAETVWMPEGDDGESGDGSEAGDELACRPVPGAENGHGGGRRRATICVSSQVGCAVNCQFCLTALLGLQRNLTAAEIVGQVIVVLQDRKVSPPQQRVNLVFMGQGEPFHNYNNFIVAVRLLVEGVGIPESRMTVSTAGIVPRIADLGREPVRPKLAISLNAPTDALRSQIMPLNRKWRIADLMEAARRFPLRTRERLTFEYVLLAGVNDSTEQARELSHLLKGIRAKVNLIALNPGPGIVFSTPSQERVLAFQQVLTESGIPAFIRRPRGRDIFAACGQLKRTVELSTAS